MPFEIPQAECQCSQSERIIGNLHETGLCSNGIEIKRLAKLKPITGFGKINLLSAQSWFQ